MKQQQVINKRNIVLNMKTLTSSPNAVASAASGIASSQASRIVKPGISFVQKISQPGSIQTTSKSPDVTNAFVAKVLTGNAKGQLVSLSDLKQANPSASISRTGFTTTSSASSSSTEQQSSGHQQQQQQFVQISSSNANVQIPQYTVVSQNRPILTTTTTPQRINCVTAPKPIVRTSTPNSE